VAIINGSRRKRIAGGSGTSVPDVNRLIKSYGEARKMMRQMTGAGGGKKKKGKKRLKKAFFPF
jgi:signal recognition particle subunit SRP54